MSALVLTFLAVFVIGPVAFFRLTRRAASQAKFWALAVAISLCVLVSLGLRFALPQTDDTVLWVSIILMWAAWVLVLAFAVLRLRMAHPGPTVHRLSGLLGAFGTTVPWFGLVTARLLTP